MTDSVQVTVRQGGTLEFSLRRVSDHPKGSSSSVVRGLRRHSWRRAQQFSTQTAMTRQCSNATDRQCSSLQFSTQLALNRQCSLMQWSGLQPE